MTKPLQPELTLDRPREIVTNSTAEFLALCDRAKAGEFRIESIEVGEGAGQWVCLVRWK